MLVVGEANPSLPAAQHTQQRRKAIAVTLFSY